MDKKTYLFVGPPGSGKGTQAEKLASSLGLPHIDVGQLLRDRAASSDETGKLINSIMLSGKTVPEEVVLKELLEHLKELDITRGLILDGYCRTTAQAHQLIKLEEEEIIPPLLVISIEVPDQLLLGRISKRQYCILPGGERVLIDQHFTEADCLAKGGQLLKREDDNTKTFDARLQVYHQQTKPAISLLTKNNNLIRVNGEPGIEIVAKNILTKVKSL